VPGLARQDVACVATPAAVLQTESSAEAVHVTTESECPGWLVVMETAVHGWEASVDGLSAPILPAEGGFIAVPVPAGGHRVAVMFQRRVDGWAPYSLAAGLVCLLLVVLAGARRARPGMV